MFDFYLFRMKVYTSEQIPLFESDHTTAQTLKSVLEEKPSAELRQGYVWHIGNVAPLSNEGLYFALGRTTKSILETYDERQGNFIEEDFETSPYTHAFVDLSYQVLALAKKTRLAPTVRGMAKQLEKLLNSSRYIRSYESRIEISQIDDPEDFVQLIRQAYSVTRFTMEFGEPNPWDANEDFQKPMQELLKESHGRKGKTSIAGDDLERNTLEELSRAAASAGNDAQATVKTSESSRGTTKHLRGNPAVVTEGEIDSEDEKIGVVQRIRQYYESIRRYIE